MSGMHIDPMENATSYPRSVPTPQSARTATHIQSRIARILHYVSVPGIISHAASVTCIASLCRPTSDTE
eukprot:3941128-Rhodomonas_salina.4